MPTLVLIEDRLLDGADILVTQNGVPFLQGGELTNTMRAFQALFADWTCYLATVPTYAGGPMAFGWGTDGTARRVTREDLAEQAVEDILDTEGMDEALAGKLIMAARAHWFTDDEDTNENS